MEVDSKRRLLLLAMSAQCVTASCSCGGGGSAATSSPGSPNAPLSPAPTGGPPVQFPLRVEVGKRHLVDAWGSPFLLHGDAAWSMVVQLTNAEIATYLDSRAALGFNAILLNVLEHRFSNQTPRYRNVDGDDPFATMTNFGSTMNEAYWRRLDFIVDECKLRSIACVMFPAYWGWNDNGEGWIREIVAATDMELQVYGKKLAQRYAQGNVIWSMGGDYNYTATERAKQWRIAEGILSIRPSDIVTAHPRLDSSAIGAWGEMPGLSLNCVYAANDTGRYVYAEALAEYDRSGGMPFFLFESRYEQEPSPPVAVSQLRAQTYQALLSGACGQFFGNNPIWHFGCADSLFPYSGTWQANLSSAGAKQQQIAKRLFDLYPWYSLAPKVDGTLVSTPLGSGGSRICPALAADASFALIYVPGGLELRVNLGALAPPRLRVRVYDPANGSYAPIDGSPFANAGWRTFSLASEGLVVIDAG